MSKPRALVLLGIIVVLLAVSIPALGTRSPALRRLALTVWNLRYPPVRAPAAGPVTVFVRASARRQVMEGFGASVRTLVSEGRDTLTPSLRLRALDALYRQVGITMGMVDQMLVESRSPAGEGQNDNHDPRAIDWSGFQTRAVDVMKTKLFDLPPARGFDDYHLGQRVNTRWASPWLADLRKTDYRVYVDEAAEQIVAACIYWRDHVGPVPRRLQPFNEPLSGNEELRDGTRQDLVDIVKRTGDRLATEGFGDVRFVVPSEETEEQSYTSASAILADPHARSYVGAIGYHPYPYESPYANIRRLLRTSGLGHPDASRIAARQRLRELARAHNLPLWMTEVSNGGVDPRSYDDFRGRAIHIHDELTYADAAAYLAMASMWDISQPLHDTVVGPEAHEGTVVLVDSREDSVTITGIGYAMGHYARWVHRGAVRVEADAGDTLLQVTAFRDDRRGTLTLVLINNAGSSRTATVKVDGVRLSGEISGEQSTASAYWKSVPPILPRSDGFEIAMPETSVTSLMATFEQSPSSGTEQRN